MTSKYHYQLDTEYRNRQMMQAENARLAQEVQPDKPQHNYVSAFIKAIQRIFRRQPQAQVADIQVQQSPVNA